MTDLKPQILALFQAGTPQTEIAAELGISRAWVSQVAVEAGVIEENLEPKRLKRDKLAEALRGHRFEDMPIPSGTPKFTPHNWINDYSPTRQSLI